LLKKSNQYVSYYFAFIELKVSGIPYRQNTLLKF
jgi:hypothetical protein